MPKKKILIIEDEQTLCHALEELLSPDYEVDIAIDGEAGLEKLKSFKPDLVLLDLILPKMDGFSVMHKMKQEQATKNIPTLVLSNLSDVTDKIKQLGGEECMVKSDYSMEDIKNKIKQHLA